MWVLIIIILYAHWHFPTCQKCTPFTLYTSLVCNAISWFAHNVHILYLCGLILQVSDLTGRLLSRDREFDAYRQQVLSKPESKLQAELTMIHMEKVSVSHCLVLYTRYIVHSHKVLNRVTILFKSLLVMMTILILRVSSRESFQQLSNQNNIIRNSGVELSKSLLITDKRSRWVCRCIQE